MKRILILAPCPGVGSGAEIVLEELLQSWKVSEIIPVLLAPKASRIHDTAVQLNLEWYDFTTHGTGLHLSDNLRVLRSIESGLPRCDAVVAWTIRGFPAIHWLGEYWHVPAMGVLHDNPFPQKIHGPVLWNFQKADLRSLRVWKKILWSSREYVLRTWRWWQRAHHSANQFKLLVCVSDAVRRDCEVKGYKCPLKVIRNGLDDRLPAPFRFHSSVRLGFLGAGAPQRKGFSVVKRWIYSRPTGFIWNLYGGASKKIQKRIQKMERYGDVRNRGFQDRETIFNEIDVLVHTSTLFDPLPTVLIEAARAGIPCVASSNGGAGEIVEDGVSGFIFDPKRPDEGLEMLKRLLDPDLREKMGRSARKIFEKHFRVKRMVGEYEKVFEELVNLGDAKV